MIKAVFLDIDWTLLSHNTNSVPVSAVDAIRKYQKRGIEFIMATGRNMYEMQFLPIDGVQFDGFITINGQLILDKNKNVLFKKSITNMEPLVKVFNDKDIPIMFIEDDIAYVNFCNDYVKRSLKDINTPVPKVMEYTGNEICQAVFFADEKELPKHTHRFPGFGFLRWHPKAVDVTLKGLDKVSGLKWYCKHNNLSSAEIMAVGDGQNDIKMIKYAGTGVAMGNGSEEVKAVSDYVGDDIDNDGLAKVLDLFLD
ncbi:MAG: HAD family hydrolase [Coriobacteriia bacterium]|nr:HAD family hydrolase [Coriobacteriia bacterium]